MKALSITPDKKSGETEEEIQLIHEKYHLTVTGISNLTIETG